jgi:hypothetical protein
MNWIVLFCIIMIFWVLDLVDLLTRIGLAKYATLFEDQEVS